MIAFLQIGQLGPDRIDRRYARVQSRSPHEMQRVLLNSYHGLRGFYRFIRDFANLLVECSEFRKETGDWFFRRSLRSLTLLKFEVSKNKARHDKKFGTPIWIDGGHYSYRGCRCLAPTWASRRALRR